MNSNRKKVKCLSVLAEVQQYVLQNKRDPGEVVALLQPIISESLAYSCENKIRQVVEKLKTEILHGRVKFRRSIEGDYRRREILIFETTGPVFILESYVINGNLANMSNLLKIETVNRSLKERVTTHYINLTDDDLKFFFSYFEKARNEIEKEYLDEALNY